MGKLPTDNHFGDIQACAVACATHKSQLPESLHLRKYFTPKNPPKPSRTNPRITAGSNPFEEKPFSLLFITLRGDLMVARLVCSSMGRF